MAATAVPRGSRYHEVSVLSPSPILHCVCWLPPQAGPFLVGGTDDLGQLQADLVLSIYN